MPCLQPPYKHNQKYGLRHCCLHRCDRFVICCINDEGKVDLRNQTMRSKQCACIGERKIDIRHSSKHTELLDRAPQRQRVRIFCNQLALGCIIRLLNLGIPILIVRLDVSESSCLLLILQSGTAWCLSFAVIYISD